MAINNPTDGVNKYFQTLTKDKEFEENIKIVRARKEAQLENERKFQSNAKAKLIKLIEKKFKTTYIGALASFEEAFGHLWGHGKNVSELTSQEKEFAEKWANVRTEVLNKGNNNSRATQEEVSQHEIMYSKYTAESVINKLNTQRKEN